MQNLKTKSQPSEQEIREFWEWCADSWESFNKDRHRHYSFGTEYTEDEPPIDLNNLFKYAVPKVRESHSELLIRWQFGSCDGCQIYEWRKKYSRKKNLEWLRIGQKTDKDPALALFWAIWEIIQKEVKDG